jgi:hypothetical protein
VNISGVTIVTKLFEKNKFNDGTCNTLPRLNECSSR